MVRFTVEVFFFSLACFYLFSASQTIKFLINKFLGVVLTCQSSALCSLHIHHGQSGLQKESLVPTCPLFRTCTCPESGNEQETSLQTASQPGHNLFQLLPSGGRYRAPNNPIQEWFLSTGHHSDEHQNIHLLPLQIISTSCSMCSWINTLHFCSTIYT